jgi:ABC-2 type transport system ATP-binding protein
MTAPSVPESAPARPISTGAPPSVESVPSAFVSGVGAALAANGTPAVEIVGLTKVFKTVRAVDNIDLTVAPGEIFGLLGPNGAGKSTTIKILTTLLPATSGRAAVAGFDVVTNPADVRRSIGYVPQLLSAEGALTGRENLLISARLHRVPRAERDRRIDEALAFMELTAAGQRLASTYSGGMVRRLELARAMLHEPIVLFLDEPTIGLDPLAREAVWKHVAQLRDRLGTTIVMTTHYMEEADSLCDRVAIMHGGRIAVIGEPTELKAAAGPGASLEDVFRRSTGADMDSTGGSFREVARTRRTARRMG